MRGGSAKGYYGSVPIRVVNPTQVTSGNLPDAYPATLQPGELPPHSVTWRDEAQSGTLRARRWAARRKRLLLGVGAAFIGLAALLGVAVRGLLRRRAVVTEAEKGVWGSQTYTIRYQELKQPEMRRSENGKLDTTFHIMPAHITEGPVSYLSRTYEGTVPGPTLVVKPGDTLRIKQVNKLQRNLKGAPVVEHALRLPNTTTIHTHGLHISPAGIADNIFRTLGAGEEADSVYHIRPDHQRGLFYYHPHYHGSSTIQMAGGMAGAIIVEGDPTTLPEDLAKARDILMVMQHVNVEAGTFRNYVYESKVSGSALGPAVNYAYRGAPGNYFIVNGQYQPVVTVRPGEVVRLRIVHAGINDYLAIHLPGCDMYEIAADGVMYDTPRPKQGVLMVVGSRREVLVKCPAAGMYTASSVKPDLLVQEYLGHGTDVYQGVLFHMRVDGELVEARIPTSLPAPDPESSRLFKSLLHLKNEEVNKFDFEYYTGGIVQRAGVNYTVYGVNRATRPITDVQWRVKLGEVEQWNLTSWREDGKREFVNHPFHIHVNHFQVVAMSHGDGADYKVGDWRDSISMPLSQTGDAWTLIRWRANDYVGKAPAHCHIIAHADTGMSVTFEIHDDDVDGGRSEEKDD